MTEDLDNHVHQLFETAAGLPHDQRDEFLTTACKGDDTLRSRVEQLLQWDSEAGDFLEKSPISATERAGDVIGRYTLVREIGEGGMAVVWLADQSEPINRQVAIKILKPGMDSRSVLARFQLERQVLAHLDHPLVAGILDAGMTDRGRPYVVMDYVDGTILTTFCDEQSLNVSERLRLFTQVCDVVQHAHQKGVIHRDLKPNNILVTDRDGTFAPVVIDFGIAKAVGGALSAGTIYTEHGQIIGTPEYMSPEQCNVNEHAADVRTDVYSLGVVLYQMLCGRLPYDIKDKPILDVMHIIRDKPAARPSTINRRLAGDLETILLRALEKHPDDRYQSAVDLRRDIERYLDCRPIEARPRSVIYHVRMFSKRHRPIVAAAAVALISLVIGIIVSWRATFVAQSALRASERRERELEVVTSFQESLLSDVDVRDMGVRLRAALEDAVAVSDEESTARLTELSTLVEDVNFTSVALRLLDESMLQRAHTSITDQFEDQPILRARLQHSLATTMSSLGLHEGARPILDEALRTRREHLGPDHDDTLQSQHALGTINSTLGDYDAATDLLEDARRRATKAQGADARLTLRISSTLGGVHRYQGDLDGAERIWVDTLERQRRVLGSDHQDTLRTLNNLGIVFILLGRLEETERMWREVIERRRRVLGPEHPLYLGSLSNLGLLLAEMGRFDDAVPLIRESLAGERLHRGDSHPSTLVTMAALASLLVDIDQFEEAEALLQEAVDGRRAVLGPTHPDTLRAETSLAYVHHKLGRSTQAEQELQRTLQAQRDDLGPDHPDTLVTMDQLTEVLRDNAKIDEAFALSAEALAQSRRALPESHWENGDRLSRYAQLLFESTSSPDAADGLLEGHAMLVAALGEAHHLTQDAAQRLADFYAALHAADPAAGHDESASQWQHKAAND